MLDRMKATIEIPDELYLKVEAKSAQQGRPIGAVTIELFERWLAEQEDVPLTRRARAEALLRWMKRADELMKDAPAGPTAREILEADRDRLERR